MRILRRLSERGVAAGSRFNRITIALQSSKIFQEDCYKISILIITRRLVQNLSVYFRLVLFHCALQWRSRRRQTFAHVHGEQLFIY